MARNRKRRSTRIAETVTQAHDYSEDDAAVRDSDGVWRQARDCKYDEIDSDGNE